MCKFDKWLKSHSMIFSLAGNSTNLLILKKGEKLEKTMSENVETKQEIFKCNEINGMGLFKGV